ncbi:MAG: ABC transporter substrate-binding protein [Nocardioides sp.]
MLELLPAGDGRRGRGGHGRQRTRLRIAAAVGLLLAWVAPALALAGPAQSADKVTFTVALQNEVDSFNPFLGIEASSFEMWALTYDYLIGYSMDDMSVENTGLAESWETSSDGLTWTFKVRDGVMWSDGQPLTAADIAYTYNRINDGGPEAATWGSYLKGVTSITAPDATTLVLETKKPSATLPLLPIPIIPEHIWKDVDEKAVKTYPAEPENGQPVVGSGPFRLVEGKAGGDLYRFEANPDYWKGAPHIDEVVFRVYKSEDPAVQALIKGEVDFAENISAIQVKALSNQPNIEAINGNSPGFDEIAFNTGAVDLKTGDPIGDGNKALLDPKFRHALGYALDLAQIITKAYQGAGEPGDTIIPPSYTAYKWTPPADQAFTFDLAKAGQLLDEAGYTQGNDGKRTMPDGSPIGTLRLFARSESKTSLDVMNFFKEWLAELGIDAEVSTLESGKLTNVILDGTFDVFEWGWYVEPDPDSMLSYMTCGQRGNWSDSWYCNAEYDKLYAEQKTTVDDAARAQIVQQMQQILFDDSPYLVTAYNTIGEAVRTDRFACLRPQPDPGGIWLFQYGVYNYLNMRPASEADQCEGQAGVTQGSKETAASGGIGTGVLVAGGVVAVTGLAAAGVVLMRRRGSVGDRE